MAIFEKIYQRHVTRLKNTAKHNPKLIIAFAGTPGTGKSYLSSALADRFQGILVENDDIREIITELIPSLQPDERQRLLQEYLKTYLFARLAKLKNGLIILDSSIDRKYDLIKAAADSRVSDLP